MFAFVFCILSALGLRWNNLYAMFEEPQSFPFWPVPTQPAAFPFSFSFCFSFSVRSSCPLLLALRHVAVVVRVGAGGTHGVQCDVSMATKWSIARHATRHTPRPLSSFPQTPADRLMDRRAAAASSASDRQRRQRQSMHQEATRRALVMERTILRASDAHPSVVPAPLPLSQIDRSRRTALPLLKCRHSTDPLHTAIAC